MSEMTHDKVNELMARMLTCASAITATKDAGNPWDTDQMALDACSLLIEAATALEQLAPPPDLGPPMEIIKPLPAQPIQKKIPELSASFVDPGVAAASGPSARACPKCDSRAAKVVYRRKGGVDLECPVCGHRWPWKGAAAWL
jgi:hypothetical protein